MTPQEFCYWLQGFIEMQQPRELTETQLQMVKDHLELVFQKKTPKRLRPELGVMPIYFPSERLC